VKPVKLEDSVNGGRGLLLCNNIMTIESNATGIKCNSADYKKMQFEEKEQKLLTSNPGSRYSLHLSYTGV